MCKLPLPRWKQGNYPVIHMYSVKVSLFFSQHNGVVSPSPLLTVIFWFFFCFLIAHECDHSFGSLLTSELFCWEIILSPYTPSRKPASGLVLCSGDDAIDGDQSCSNTSSLSPILAAGSPPIKNRPGSLYDRAALIVPEGENTHRIWRPPRCDHCWSGCCPCRNRLVTEAYHRSILLDRRNYWEWKAITKVQPSSRGDIGLPPGRGYRSAPEVARSSIVVLTGSVVADPLLIVIFWGFSVIPPHRWVRPLLHIDAFLLNYLTKRSYYHRTSSLFLSQQNGVFSP